MFPVERVKSLEDWAKSARTQVGTFSHGRGDTGGFLASWKKMVNRLEDFMVRRRGAEAAAAVLLSLVLCAGYLRGRRAARRPTGRRCRL